MTRVLAFTVRARQGNAAVTMYFGHSSALSSVQGFALSSGEVFPRSGEVFTVPAGKGLRASDFWVNASASTTARLDHAMLVEP